MKRFIRQGNLFPLTISQQVEYGTRIAAMIAARPDAETLKQRSDRIREQQQKRNRHYAASHPDRDRGKRKSRPGTLSFAGVDGEGGGRDAFGRQNYLLLRAGERELFNNNRPLTTVQCLDFILSLPRNRVHVSFFFTYDVTMIMRDIPRKYLEKICGDRNKFDGKEVRRKSNFVYWEDYAIDFVPRQHFSIARIDRKSNTVIKGTARTVNETSGFFQQAFVKVCDDWKAEIGLSDEDYRKIVAGKERRESFDQLDAADREYCRLECETLAAIMERFRELCIDGGLIPQQWRGAGWLASALHRQHNTPKAREIEGIRPDQLLTYAQQAYYGGRFEITRVGLIEETVYEYDINSAYPAAMTELPCPWHTLWHKINDQMMDKELFVAHIIGQGKANAVLQPLPCRRETGVIFWPRGVEGVYWSPEIKLAVQGGFDIQRILGGYYAEKTCDCEPFAWVRDLYLYRKSLGKSTRGYPFKLGINALYGKLAQRAGSRTYHDYIAAGLITSITRARLMQAYMQAPSYTLMLATDGVYSTIPLNLLISGDLGQWELKEHPGGMFIVQPGVYWFPGEEALLPKSRGTSKHHIKEARGRFMDAWFSFLESGKHIPSVSLEIPFFCPTRLSLHRKDEHAAGKWSKVDRSISFDWKNKRSPFPFYDGKSVVTVPYPGLYLSQYYDPSVITAADETRQALEMQFEASPDFMSLEERME